MANKQLQLGIQKQNSSNPNKNHLAQIPSFGDYKDASSSFSMLKNSTDKHQMQLTQSPSSSSWKDAADAFTMLISMTNKSQEPYSSDVPSPRQLSGNSEVWLLPKKPKPPSSDQPFPKQQTANSEAWLGTSKTTMQAPTRNPNQWRALPTSGEDCWDCDGSHLHHFIEHEPSSSERAFAKLPTPNSEAWLQPRNQIMQASTKNADQHCAHPTSGKDHAGCGGSRPLQIFEHEPCSSKQPLPKRPTPESEAWLRLRKPIMPVPTKNPNQHYATPTVRGGQGGCGGSCPHQSFEFEPSSSEQPCPKRSTPNFEVFHGPRKPEPKPPSSEQHFPKHPTANSEARSGPIKQVTSSSEQPFSKRATANSKAWQRGNPVPLPSQTPYQRRETPPRNPQPNSNSRSTNNFPNPTSRPLNTFPPKFNPGVKRKAPDTNSKYRPAPQPSIDYITNIIKRRSVNDYFCELCQVNSSSALTLRMHLRGRKHKNNAKYCRQNNICREGARGIHRCDTCHISCTDRRSLMMHLQGKKHLERLQKVEHGEVGVQKPIRCELCMANCMNEDCFNEHIHGKQHAVQLELASRRVI